MHLSHQIQAAAALAPDTQREVLVSRRGSLYRMGIYSLTLLVIERRYQVVIPQTDHYNDCSIETQRLQFTNIMILEDITPCRLVGMC